MGIYRVEIPFKLPSCNQYINECRRNRYAGAKMKKNIQKQIGVYIKQIPKIDKPVKINFIWVEDNKRRDLDGICFAKKFILDALVQAGVLQDDNRKIVTNFTDSFKYSNSSKVIVELEEIDNERNGKNEL